MIQCFLILQNGLGVVSDIIYVDSLSFCRDIARIKKQVQFKRPAYERGILFFEGLARLAVDACEK